MIGDPEVGPQGNRSASTATSSGGTRQPSRSSARSSSHSRTNYQPFSLPAHTQTQAQHPGYGLTGSTLNRPPFTPSAPAAPKGGPWLRHCASPADKRGTQHLLAGLDRMILDLPAAIAVRHFFDRNMLGDDSRQHVSGDLHQLGGIVEPDQAASQPAHFLQ